MRQKKLEKYAEKNEYFTEHAMKYNQTKAYKESEQIGLSETDRIECTFQPPKARPVPNFR